MTLHFPMRRVPSIILTPPWAVLFSPSFLVVVPWCGVFAFLVLTDALSLQSETGVLAETSTEVELTTDRRTGVAHCSAEHYWSSTL